MQRHDFYYELPPELIASYPLEQRGAGRLLCLDRVSGVVAHRQFEAFLGAMRPGDLLVFNNTRVIPARLFGEKASGGKVEVLVERVLDDYRALAHVRASKSPQAGSRLRLEETVDVEVLGRERDLFVLQFHDERNVMAILDAVGHLPLPHYFKRADEIADRERYQTVYAKTQGSVAAPTAGLHFDAALLNQLQQKGVEIAFVTLHIGAGTFQPVRVKTLTEHVMHTEWLSVSADVCARVQATRAAGGRVIAVGTTSVRCLETASQSGEISPFEGETNLFIYPGYRFYCIDGLLTNFHLPESSLLMLVSAFAGHTHTLAAYAQAIEAKYRFFSYGDAMLIV